MTKQEYTELIIRDIEGMISATEKEQLSQWETDHADTARRIRSRYENLLKNEPNIEVDTHAQFQELRGKLSPTEHAVRSIGSRWWMVAAAVVLAAGLYIGLIRQPETSHYAALDDSMEQVTLPDASRIWLDRKATASYTLADDTRTLALEGRAFFDIEPDPSQPFQISCGETLVEVVGTAFEVNANGQDVEVQVLEGTVRVSTSSVSESVTITKGEVAIVQPHRILTDQIDQAVAAWRVEEISFSNQSIRESLDILESYYPVVFTLDASQLRNCKTNGSIGFLPLPSLIEVLESMLNATIEEIDDQTYQITGPACQ